MVTKCWRDHTLAQWLTTSSTAKIISPKSMLDDNATVHELIHGDTRRWNSDLIDSIFLSAWAAQIKQIPLAPHMPQESGPAHLERKHKWVLTVKSVPILLHYIKSKSRISPDKWWKRSWKALWGKKISDKG